MRGPHDSHFDDSLCGNGAWGQTQLETWRAVEAPGFEPEMPDLRPECMQVFTETTLDWQSAEAGCTRAGGHLVSVHTREQFQALDALVSASDVREAWIGFNDRTNENDWVWSDLTENSFKEWGYGEPNDWQNGEDCAFGADQQQGRNKASWYSGAWWDERKWDRCCGSNHDDPRAPPRVDNCGEDCGVVNAGLRWEDKECGEALPYVCNLC